MLDRAQLPANVILMGVLAFPGTLLLAARLVYEQTYMTWTSGPQMVGFTMAHVYVLWLMLGGLCVVLSHAWMLVVLGYLIWKRPALSKRVVTLVVVMALTLATFYVPYSAWQRLMIVTFGPGPAADELLTYAVALGDRHVTVALLDRGRDVNSKHEGATLLHIAVRQGNVQMAKLLLDRGADRNAVDSDGISVTDRVQLKGNRGMSELFGLEVPTRLQAPSEKIVVRP